MKYDLSVIRTDRGNRIRVRRRIEGSSLLAWEQLIAVDCWPEWGPLITDVDYGEQRIREGTSGRVQLLGLLWIPFEIVSTGEFYWTWKVMGMTPPADGHRIEKISDNNCRISFELPLWAFAYVPICLRALRNIKKTVGT